MRPARPRRWSAEARETRTVSSRVSPTAGSKRGTRASPESTTTRTPSMVSEVSAIEVASTTLRRPGGARRDRAVLHVRVERAVERHHVDRGIGDALAHEIAGAADFGRARQERKHRARLLAHRAFDRVGHLPLDRRARIAAEIARLDLEGAALALDHRRIAEKLRHPRAVERRRHGENAQILAQPSARIERQRKPQIRVERALVELVEQHRGDPFQFRILEHEPREHALGDHLDPGLARDFRAEAHAEADRLARGLAQAPGHACRRRARRQPPRLQHQNFPPRDPGLVQERQRNARRLAGARRRHQHRRASRNERIAQARQRLVDRQRLAKGIGHRLMLGSTRRPRIAGGGPRVKLAPA